VRLTTLADSSAQRTGIALVLVGAFCFSLAIPFTRWEPVRQVLNRGTVRRLVPLGLAVSATVMLYTYAVRHTTAASAALLVNSAPIYVAVLAPLVLGEPRARYTWLSLALAFSGMALMANPARLDVRSSELTGIVAAALSGVGYGLVMLISRSLRGRISGLTQNLWSNGTIMLVLFPWALRAPGAAVASNLHLLIPLGIFSLGLSYLLYFQGLQRISAQQVSVVSLAEPVFGVLMGLVFFAEVPNALGWIGAALILASITLITR